MGVIKFAIENPVKIAVGVILLVLFGLLSALNIRVQLVPDVDRPVVVVKTNWTGASPQEIETEIVQRQEDKLKNVTGLRKMTSTCTNNEGEVKLEFPVGIDKDTAFRDVSDKLRQVSGYPEEVDEPTMLATDASMDKTIAWMMLYSQHGNDISELKTFIEDNVKPILERAEGISEVSVYGGRDREIQIEVDPYKLAARGLTMREVESAIRGQNKTISAGTIATGKRDYTYRTLGEFDSIEAVEKTVIAYREGGAITIGDVAIVIDGFKKRFGFVRSKGQPVIAIPARRETGANVIKAMENLRVQVDLVNREILTRKGLQLEMTQVYDETDYIWSAINLVLKNILVGGALAVGVLLLFLRSTSATGIIAAAIPISVIGTMLVVILAGRSLNVVLLAGTAFATGMVVDNAIVVLENIYRHLSMGKSRSEAALDGTKEVWGAVLASTLTTMAVFLPIITIQDEAGQLFKDIAIAVSSAVGLSLIVSILVIPPLAAKYFNAPRHTTGEAKPWRLAQKVGAFVGMINRGIGRRLVTVAGISFVAITGSFLLIPDTEYMPACNKNLIFGFLAPPPGYSVDEFQRMADVVENGDPNDPTDGLQPYWDAELNSEAEAKLTPVEIKFGKTGEDVRTVRPPPIDNFFFVSFGGGVFMGCTSKDADNVRPLEYVMNRAGSRLPGVFAMFSQSSLFSSGGSGSGNAIDVQVRSDSLDDVVVATKAIRRAIQQAGYRRPRSTPSSFALGRPEIQLVPDRDKAADLNLDVNDIGFIVRACIDGAFVGEYNDRGDKVDMVIKVARAENASPGDIKQTPIFTPSGHIVPLSAAVSFKKTTAPQQISRIEQMSAVTLAVRPKPGVPLQATMRELENEIIAPLRAEGKIADTVITSLAGSASKLTQTQRALLGNFTGLLNRPTIFGLSVSMSLFIWSCISIFGGATLGAFMGVRFALRSGALALVALAVFVLASNLDFTAMLFQSRAILALLVTYLLMAALFESFLYPLVILFTVPLAAVGGFLSLRIVHEQSFYNVSAPIQQLDVLTMLGFVILIGIVVNNAILIVHQALTYMRRDHMRAGDAVQKSIETRTRPIIMSAMTSIFGMFPLVVMPGAGSELYRGLGSVVLGGLLISTIFTLIVIPSALTLVLDFQKWLESKSAHDARQPQYSETVAVPAVASRSPYA